MGSGWSYWWTGYASSTATDAKLSTAKSTPELATAITAAPSSTAEMGNPVSARQPAALRSTTAAILISTTAIDATATCGAAFSPIATASTADNADSCFPSAGLQPKPSNVLTVGPNP